MNASTSRIHSWGASTLTCPCALYYIQGFMGRVRPHLSICEVLMQGFTIRVHAHLSMCEVLL